MNWVVRSNRESPPIASLYTPERLIENLLAVLASIEGINYLDPYRDASIASNQCEIIVTKLAEAAEHRRDSLAREIIGIPSSGSDANWQKAWLEQLVAKDKWSRHLYELIEVFRCACERGWPVEMLSD